MAELLKHIYNDRFFGTYTEALTEVLPIFEGEKFLSYFNTAHWASLELKQRMAYLSHITNKWLPIEFPQKVEVILNLIKSLRNRKVKDQNLEYIFLADLISEHGIDDLKTSIVALEKITSFVSCEFAGRLFIIKYPKEMMRQVLQWAKHKNPNVRRFASEVCRPKLPWGIQLKMLVIDPSPIIPVLELLKNDTSLYVRKSVANNLNDISKDHPHLVLQCIKRWANGSENISWLLKHGARTLLKNGHSEALEIFGIDQNISYELTQFCLEQQYVSAESPLWFRFELTNKEINPVFFRLEYYIYFVKSLGKLTKKIFKITERYIAPEETYSCSKMHRFHDLTTRKHHSGIHKISIVVNGVECEALDFVLEINS